VLRERTKGDRLEEHMKKAREQEERQASDQAIYDLLEITFAAPSSSKVQSS
jgi:hypothetical protein